MLMADAVFRDGFELREIGREEQADEPIHGDAHFAVQPGHLHQVDGAPEEPGDDAGNLEAEVLRHGRSVAERAERAETFEGELAGGAAADGDRKRTRLNSSHVAFSRMPRPACK